MAKPTDIAGYIAAVKDPAFAQALRGLHARIVAELGAQNIAFEECLSYAMPGFRHRPASGKRGKMIAGYAAFVHVCSLYPHSGSVVPQLGAHLAGRSYTKSALHFTPDDPIPQPLLAAMIAERMAQISKA